MSDFTKRGTVKRTVHYKDRQTGEERARYVTVGEYWSTEVGNSRSIKIYATLNTDEQWLNIYPLEDDRSPTHEFNKQVHKDVLPTDKDMEQPINLDDVVIPF